MQQGSDNFRAGLIMLVAVGSLSAMDACLKALSAAYPPLEVAAVRALASLPIIVVWIGATGGFRQLVRVRASLHVLRGLLGIFMLAAFIYGVRALPLSTAYTIFFIAPMLITTFAALMLRERVEWQRWAAIALGFAAVIIVLRPSGSGVLTRGGIAVLLAAVAYALSAISVRILGRTDSTQSMVFWLMAMIAAGGTLLALPDWRAIESRHAWIIACVALAGFVGQWALTEAFKRGESSFIATFEYTALAWGVSFDWFVWRTVPSARTWFAAALIVACGVYLIRRERAAPAPAAAHVPSGAIGGDAAVE